MPTEIVVVCGDHYVVDGEAQAIEEQLVAAARGSLMEFAWLTLADTREPVAINPSHVVAVRPIGS